MAMRRAIHPWLILTLCWFLALFWVGCGGNDVMPLPLEEDTTPPAVIGTNVQGGPIPVNTPIVLIFNETVNLTSAQRGLSVRSSIDAEPIKGVVTLAQDGREVRFTPIGEMPSGPYVLTALGIEDGAGNVHTPLSIFFAAVEVDTNQPVADVTPPKIVQTFPGEEQSLLSTGSLTVRFDEEIDAVSAQAGIVVSGSEGTVTVSGAVAIFTPTDPLASGQHTLAVVGIRDLAGNELESPLIVSFEVKATPVVDPPPTGKGTPAADGVIYVDVANFDLQRSQFDVVVKGNVWTETHEEGALHDTALGGPGDNNHAGVWGEPVLVIKLPMRVKQGESTADGKTWAAWARLLVPEALNTADQANSFFLRISADAQQWTPAQRGDTSLRWNDPGAMFPDSINGEDILFTDVGDQLPWFWEKHSANGQSAIDPVVAVGDNYIEIGIRESNPVDYPRIDVVCLRNDGGKPSDAEAFASLRPGMPTRLAGTLSTLWSVLKSEH